MKPLRTPRRASRRGFTLIELLVVIAIISILASILFPVFARARENARRAACQSNMKQLGLGFMQYVQDYDGIYPGAGQKQKWADGGHWVTGGDTIPADYTGTALADETAPFAYSSPKHAMADKGAIYNYVKSKQIYVCPSDPVGDKKQLSYSMNCGMGFLNEAGIQESSSLVLLIDEDITLNDGYFWAVTSTSSTTSTDSLTKIHLEGGNLLFADGHVKFFPFARFPLDNSTQGLIDKTSTTGMPHFHDGGGDC